MRGLFGERRWEEEKREEGWRVGCHLSNLASFWQEFEPVTMAELRHEGAKKTKARREEK
jgi:hypothetical protein